jgi:hypothetical protein
MMCLGETFAGLIDDDKKERKMVLDNLKPTTKKLF